LVSAYKKLFHDYWYNKILYGVLYADQKIICLTFIFSMENRTATLTHGCLMDFNNKYKNRFVRDGKVYKVRVMAPRDRSSGYTSRTRLLESDSSLTTRSPTVDTPRPPLKNYDKE
jgi:hypothetical protein